MNGDWLTVTGRRVLEGHVGVGLADSHLVVGVSGTRRRGSADSHPGAGVRGTRRKGLSDGRPGAGPRGTR